MALEEKFMDQFLEYLVQTISSGQPNTLALTTEKRVIIIDIYCDSDKDYAKKLLKIINDAYKEPQKIEIV